MAKKVVAAFKKGDGRVGVGDADHRVQKFRRHNNSIHLY